MKKFLMTFVLAALLPLSGAFASNVVFVDIQAVLKDFYKTKLAQDQILQQSNDIEIEVQEMENEIIDMKDEIEVLRKDSRDTALSDEIRSSKRDELEEQLVALQKKEQEMAEFAKLRKEQLQQQQQRMVFKLLDEVRDAVMQHAKSKGYDGVIDRAQNQGGYSAVIYAHPTFDITADVLAALNEGQLEKLEENDEEAAAAE